MVKQNQLSDLLGMPIRVFHDNFSIDGVLTKTPAREKRSEYCFAIQTDMPTYLASNPDEIFGYAINYQLLRDGHIGNYHVYENRIILLRTDDPYFLCGGGYFCDRGEIIRVEEHLQKSLSYKNKQ